ncbi:MAG: molybdopterin-dependent oxidoreductase [Holophagales bacterium]|nr:molybdopterin-dependent oxidoreductase [Holophagales bacterium]
MKLELSRRDLFLAGGGAVAGIALSPVPWKLLDDLSIWTQQPPTPTPRPAGPLAFRFTSCALCPAACGLKARCFGAQPVGFAAVPGHPASDGGLCPLGLTAHHLAKHPLRATHPERVSGGKRERIDRADAVAALSAALAACGREKRTFAVVDGRPGRSPSRTYRALAAATGGLYVTPPAAGTALSLEALAKRFDGGALALGVDFSKARRIVSFGTPVLTDAGTPGLLARLRAESRRRPAAERIEVIQVEATRGRSAALADRYIPIAPGTEAAFALGLAHVLLDEKLADAAFLAARTTGLADFAALAARFAPALVEQKTGAQAGVVTALARDLAAQPARARPRWRPGGRTPLRGSRGGDRRPEPPPRRPVRRAPGARRRTPRDGWRREARRRHLSRRAPRRLRRAPPPRRDGGRGAGAVGAPRAGPRERRPRREPLSVPRRPRREGDAPHPRPGAARGVDRAGRAGRRTLRDLRVRPRPPLSPEGPRSRGGDPARGGRGRGALPSGSRPWLTCGRSSRGQTRPSLRPGGGHVRRDG